MINSQCIIKTASPHGITPGHQIFQRSAITGFIFLLEDNNYIPLVTEMNASPAGAPSTASQGCGKMNSLWETESSTSPQISQYLQNVSNVQQSHTLCRLM